MSVTCHDLYCSSPICPRNSGNCPLRGALNVLERVTGLGGADCLRVLLKMVDSTLSESSGVGDCCLLSASASKCIFNSLNNVINSLVCVDLGSG